MACGVPPDVFYMWPDFFPAFVARAVLQPISSYMERDRYDSAVFWRRYLSQYAMRGTRYGLPWGLPPMSITTTRTCSGNST